MPVGSDDSARNNRRSPLLPPPKPLLPGELEVLLEDHDLWVSSSKQSGNATLRGHLALVTNSVVQII